MTEAQIEERQLADAFINAHGEELVGFGKYSDVRYKDVPQSYFIFIYENHKKNGINNQALEYGRRLVQRRKRNS